MALPRPLSVFLHLLNSWVNKLMRFPLKRVYPLLLVGQLNTVIGRGLMNLEVIDKQYITDLYLLINRLICPITLPLLGVFLSGE